MEENTTMVEETTMTTVDDDGIIEYYYDGESENGGLGKVVAIALAGVAGGAALGVTAYKKLKAKKDATSKKKTKKRLRWVEVPVDEESNDVIDSEAEVISEEESEE